jgi:hypothetical protein
MKKVLVAAILGLATVTSVMAQGHVNISNYLTAPYNQVFWGSGTPLQGQALMDASIQLQIWYGAGVVTDASTLIPGITFAVNPTLGFNPGAGHGPGGYYGAQTQVVPTAVNYTSQIRASGTTAFGPATGASVLWQSTTISTALPAPTDPNSIGFVVNVPEPSSFALAGLGSAVLLIFRRRK